MKTTPGSVEQVMVSVQISSQEINLRRFTYTGPFFSGRQIILSVADRIEKDAH
jgi:hypothetical protein